MCGIIGMASATLLVKKDVDWFKQALFCDQLRGADSTGIIRVPRHPQHGVDVFKKAYAASDYLQLAGSHRIMSDINMVKALVGHNRYATKGSVNHDNAHPFTSGQITLVHNGTLKHYAQLPGYDKWAVDSALIARGFSELGVQETIDKITGAYALVWHDAEDNSLNLLRNAERPMAIATSRGGKEFYFASEEGMLEWLLDRNGIYVEEVMRLAPDQHIKLDLNGKIFAPVIREVKKKATVITSKKKSNLTVVKDKKEEKNKPPGNIPVVGEEILGYFSEVETYKNTVNMGCIKGTTLNAPHCEVECHNFVLENFKEGIYRLQVCNTTWSSQDTDFIVRGIGAKYVDKLEILEGGNPSEKKPKGADAPSATSEDSAASKPKGSTSNAQAGSKTCSEKSKDTETTTSPSDGKKPSTQTAKRIKLRRATSEKVKVSVKETLENLLPANGLDDEGHVEHLDRVVGPNGGYVSFDVFNTLTKHGCAHCQADLFLSEAEDITWKDSQTPVCLSCAEEDAMWAKYQKLDDNPLH